MKNTLAVLLAALALCPAVALGAAAAATKPPPPPPPGTDLPPPPPPPPMPPSNTSECFPACRNGFFCHSGQCVSSCNPPCGPGEVCATNGQCIAGYAEPDLRRDSRNEDNERAPPGFHFERRRRIGLMIGGLVPLGLGYFSSIAYGVYSATTYYSGYNGAGNAFYAVPVLGPLLRELSAIGSYNYNSNNYLGTDLLLTVIFTAAQGVGLLLTLLGLRSTMELVSDRESSRETSRGIQWSLAPGAGRSPLGLTLVFVNP